MNTATTSLRTSVFLLGCTLLAQDPTDPAPREWVGGAPITEWTRLTGDWGGLRSQLEQLGIEVAGGFTSDLAAPWSGDTRRRSSVSSLIDLNVAFDLDTLLGWKRTIFYVDAYKIVGRNPTNDVGDFGGMSNIQGNDVEQIAEV